VCYGRILFTGGQVFDGTGAEPAVADVTVQDGRIVEVGSGLDADQAVDCAGRAVLPGLFDCHVHLTLSRLDALEWISAPFSLQFYEAARNLRDTLRVGITTVRDAGGADLGIRLAQERGLAPGPRLRVSIRLLSQTGGHGDPWEASGCSVPIFMAHPGRPDGVVDGPDQARRKVRELVRAGADELKIATTAGCSRRVTIPGMRISATMRSRPSSPRPRPRGSGSWPTRRATRGSRRPSVAGSGPSSTASSWRRRPSR
jgi:imidazolonepropionase-like amidohydrolase